MSAGVRKLVASHALAAVGMSLPWPLLLLLVWEQTHSGLLLGAAGAARMLPYVAFSWAAGRLADRYARDRIVRLSVAVRIVLMIGVAAALQAGATWVALAAATLAIAAATPAYPALAAAMPAVAGRTTERATNLLVTLLVTCEVASFVVGPALGGLLLAPGTRAAVPWLAVALLAGAAGLITDISLPTPRTVAARDHAGVLSTVRRSRPILLAIAAVSLVNMVAATVGLALLPLAETGWAAPGGVAYGVATGALGFGAVGGPLLARLGARRRLRAGAWLALLACCLGLVAVSPGLAFAVLPLAIAGAAAVQVETVATGAIQRHAPDPMRATVLGMTDTAMVAAALVGALVAPVLAGAMGARALVLGTGAVCLAGILLVRVPADRQELPRLAEPAAPSTVSVSP
jgi:MFS family permease